MTQLLKSCTNTYFNFEGVKKMISNMKPLGLVENC